MPGRAPCWSILVLALVASGCSGAGNVQQGSLATHQRARSDATSRSLVLSGAAAGDEEGWLAARNDVVTRTPSKVYVGPGGRMFYADGTPVPFEGVRKQLENLRAENSIRP